jgi:uncharacterized protein with ATP-grasp and redox domains
MQTYFDCVPCAIRQVLDSVRMITADEAIHERVLRATLGMWRDIDLRQSPPAIAAQTHRLVRRITGVADPYLEVKDRYNRLALEMCPELRGRVENSGDPFEAAVRLAIAGNIIDFGVSGTVEQESVRASILRSLAEPIDRRAVAWFKAAVARAQDILYLGDNAGEIVFDRLLIERMPRERVTFVVRGSPILNDALVEDAETAGITDLVKVMDNGSDAPGTILESCSEAFRRQFESADLVVAKGQGNFESLAGTKANMFFLLRPKCAVLSRHLGCEIGRLIVLHGSEVIA